MSHNPVKREDAGKIRRTKRKSKGTGNRRAAYAVVGSILVRPLKASSDGDKRTFSPICAKLLSGDLKGTSRRKRSDPFCVQRRPKNAHLDHDAYEIYGNPDVRKGQKQRDLDRTYNRIGSLIRAANQRRHLIRFPSTAMIKLPHSPLASSSVDHGCALQGMLPIQATQRNCPRNRRVCLLVLILNVRAGAFSIVH
jgi:hypothetical protein